MKFCFFLIAVVNLALFMWEYKSGAFDPLPETTQHAGLENLEDMLLVRELPPPVITTLVKTEATKPPAKKTSIDSTAQEEIASKEKTPVVKEVEHCYEVGPFANKKSYNAWLAETKAIKKTIKPLRKTEQTAASYLVYYPIATTSISPQAASQLLNSHGITDLYVMQNGEHKGQLSLGLFSTQERASNLQRAMQAKGVRVEVKPRYKATDQHYAFVKSSETLVAPSAAVKKIAPEFTVKAVSNVKGCQ